MFGTSQPTTPQTSTPVTPDPVSSMKNSEQEAPSPDGPCYYQLQLSEKDFYSPTIQQFLKNLSRLLSHSPSVKTQLPTTVTQATPATPLSTPEVTVGKDAKKSHEQLELEPFILDVLLVKKEPLSDHSDDDLQIINPDAGAVTMSPDSKPCKLTEKQTNGRTLTDGLDFLFSFKL